MRKSLWLLGVFVAAHAWADAPSELELKLDEHPAHHEYFWAGQRTYLPVIQRVSGPPTAVLEYLALDNQLNGFKARPRAAQLTPEEIKDWEAALNSIPPSILERPGGKFFGLFWVDDLGGSGYTELVRGTKEDVVGAFMVFDRKALFSRGGNAWATWKESSPFLRAGESDPQVEVEIEGDVLTPRAYGLRFVFLHEWAHVLAATEGHHPSWDAKVRTSYSKGNFPLISWNIDNKAAVSRKTLALSKDWQAVRKDLVFYQKPRIPAAQMQGVYQQLVRTSFPTLYAGTNVTDDFADSFALYVHSRLLGDPFRLKIVQGTNTLLKMGPCWDEPRCAAKSQYFEAMLKKKARH